MVCFKIKKCMLKRRTYKGLKVPYIINDDYINDHNDGHFFDISNSNDIRLKQKQKFVQHSMLGMFIDHVFNPIWKFQVCMQRVIIETLYTIVAY